MSIRISFDLSDQDVKHFQRIAKNARSLVKDAGEDEITGKTEQLLKKVKTAKTPDFINERLDNLRSLLDMLRDKDWALGGAERERVLTALAYFCDPEDVIPDVTPGFGFLDDAIMVELVNRELKHEIEAYADFRAYCERENKRTGRHSATRGEWLESKRKELFERMRRRIRRDRGSAATINRIF